MTRTVYHVTTLKYEDHEIIDALELQNVSIPEEEPIDLYMAQFLNGQNRPDVEEHFDSELFFSDGIYLLISANQLVGAFPTLKLGLDYAESMRKRGDLDDGSTFYTVRWNPTPIEDEHDNQ